LRVRLHKSRLPATAKQLATLRDPLVGAMLSSVKPQPLEETK
jgi:hypothetical protein